MSKQTAVEWLIEELKNELGYCVDLGYTDQIVLDKILNHYKEIEKEQRAEDWQLGYDSCEFHNDYENLQTKPINNPYK
jgi:hypothetical protein